jgi:hypothetical protein
MRRWVGEYPMGVYTSKAALLRPHRVFESESLLSPGLRPIDDHKVANSLTRVSYVRIEVMEFHDRAPYQNQSLTSEGFVFPAHYTTNLIRN